MDQSVRGIEALLENQVEVQLRWKWLMVASVAACSLAAVAFAADAAVTGVVRGWDLPGDLAKAIELSEAFAHGFGAAAILGTVLLVAEDRRRLVWIGITITVLSGVSANLAKAGFVRIRPHSVGSIVVDESQVIADAEVVAASFWDARQRSFPSGHSATAWGLAIALSLIFPRGKYLFSSLAVLASLQRVVSGAHFPSDVFAGAAIAFLCAGCVIAWASRRASLSQTDEQPPKLKLGSAHLPLKERSLSA